MNAIFENDVYIFDVQCSTYDMLLLHLIVVDCKAVRRRRDDIIYYSTYQSGQSGKVDFIDSRIPDMVVLILLFISMKCCITNDNT